MATEVCRAHYKTVEELFKVRQRGSGKDCSNIIRLLLLENNNQEILPDDWGADKHGKTPWFRTREIILKQIIEKYIWQGSTTSSMDFILTCTLHLFSVLKDTSRLSSLRLWFCNWIFTNELFWKVFWRGISDSECTYEGQEIAVIFFTEV